MGSKLTGFLRRILSSDGGGAGEPESGPPVDYNGYAIRPAPRRQGSQWLTAGVIAKTFPEGVKEHSFIRAETHGSKEAADAFSLTKAKQIIDEQGDHLFKDG